jgi:hypothetical protein
MTDEGISESDGLDIIASLRARYEEIFRADMQDKGIPFSDQASIGLSSCMGLMGGFLTCPAHRGDALEVVERVNQLLLTFVNEEFDKREKS